MPPRSRLCSFKRRGLTDRNLHRVFTNIKVFTKVAGDELQDANVRGIKFDSQPNTGKLRGHSDDRVALPGQAPQGCGQTCRYWCSYCTTYRIHIP